MVTLATSRTSPLIEGSPLLELPISMENVASGGDNVPTTQASASLIRGKAVLGNITRAWNDVMPPSRNITLVKKSVYYTY